MLFTNNANEFETAYYFPTFGDRVKCHAIGVEVVGERQKQFSTLVQGLIADNSSTVLKTSYSYDYKIGNEIKYRGKYWAIRGVATDTRALNPQALAFAAPADNEYRYLDIIEVE